MVERDGGIGPLLARAQKMQAELRHFEIFEGSAFDLPAGAKHATHLIDPPYQRAGGRDLRPGARGRVRYPRGSDAIDFAALAKLAKSLPGQVVVCEQEGATWLPFERLREIGTVRPGGRSSEVVWVGSNDSQHEASE